MEKIDKFVTYWYSKIVFNTLNDITKLIFRKLETETRKLTAEILHQKFNEIYIYIYTHMYICVYACICSCVCMCMHMYRLAANNQ